MSRYHRPSNPMLCAVFFSKAARVWLVQLRRDGSLVFFCDSQSEAIATAEAIEAGLFEELKP